MDHTFTCFACKADVPLALAVPHIPKCYRDWSLSHGLRPYCTCDDCGGVMTHCRMAGGRRERTGKGAPPPLDEHEHDHDIGDHSDLALLHYCGQVLVPALALMLALALVPVMVACMTL